MLSIKCYRIFSCDSPVDEEWPSSDQVTLPPGLVSRWCTVQSVSWALSSKDVWSCVAGPLWSEWPMEFRSLRLESRQPRDWWCRSWSLFEGGDLGETPQWPGGCQSPRLLLHRFRVSYSRLASSTMAPKTNRTRCWPFHHRHYQQLDSFWRLN